MSTGISTFNKTASEKFQSLTEEDKVQLNATQANETTTLTESQIGKKISDIFGKVRDRTVTKYYRTRLYSKSKFTVLSAFNFVRQPSSIQTLMPGP